MYSNTMAYYHSVSRQLETTYHVAFHLHTWKEHIKQKLSNLRICRPEIMEKVKGHRDTDRNRN